MSIYNELKRRNVFRVTAAYVVIAWLLLQVGDVVFEALEVDASANRMLMAFVLLGLIPTVLFAWAFEMTPDGIKRDRDVVPNEFQDRQKAKKLDYITMLVLVLVGAMSLWQHWRDDPSIETTTTIDQTNSEPNMGVANVDDQSIAVLPFVNIAQSVDNEPFTVGLHDDLITHLSKISALKVISKTSVLKYKDNAKSIAEVAQDLGVAHILEGGVQRAGQSIRFNVQLVNAATEKPIWAETYNRELTASNIFQIQSEISEQIVKALQAQLTDEEVISLNKQQTTNIDAFNAYHAGRERMLVRNTESLREALSLFKKAADLDPNYALAYVGQADAWSLLNEYGGVSKEEMFEKGEPVLEFALSLDPSSAEAVTSKANYLHEKNQFEAAMNLFEHSITLNPGYPTTYHWYGLLADSMGDREKSLMLYQKAAELDPLSPTIQSNIGYRLLAANKKHEALQQFDRIIELVPDYSGGPSGKAEAFAQMGRLDLAVIWQHKAVEIDPGNWGRRLNLAGFYLDIGLLDKAKEQIKVVNDAAPDFRDLVFSLANVDMYESDYQSAADRYAMRMEQDPDNKAYIGNWAFNQMLLKNYQISVDALLKLFPGKNDDLFEVAYYNFDSTINLIWMWQQLEENDKANRVLVQLKQFLAEYPEHNNKFKEALIFMVEGNYIAAGEIFQEQFEKGEFQGFWRGDHIPMFEPFNTIPGAIALNTAYEEKLVEQRASLKAML